MSEDTTQVEENKAEEDAPETEKAHDYDPIYAFDENSGSTSQPGGLAVPGGPNLDLLVGDEGELGVVEGNDVTSEAHQAKIDAEAEGKTKEQAEADAKATEGASGEAIEAQESGDGTPAVVTDENGNPLPTGDDGLQTLPASEPVAAEAYDPSDKSVADVKAYVEGHPEEKDAILAAEAGGKNRPTIAAL